MELFRSRLILPDRIRLNITPRYQSYRNLFPDDEKEYFTETNALASEMYQKAKKKNFQINRDSKRKPYILCTSFFEYIGGVRISPFRMNSVSMEFNILRALNYRIQSTELLFDSAYFDAIRIHEDNYTISDDELLFTTYGEVISNVPENAYKVATVAYQEVMLQPPEFHYSTATIKGIEFNTDIFVGHNNSIPIMERFLAYLHTEQGRVWRLETIKAIASHVVDVSEFNPDLKTLFGSSISVKFQIGRGISLKIYTKTRDHVRAELVIDTKFIKGKYKKTNWYSCYFLLYNDARRLLKGFKIEKKLEEINENEIYEKEEDEMILECLNTVDTVCPGLSEVITAKLYSGVVTSDDGIASLRRFYKHFNKEFYMDRDKYGNPIYRYDPKEATRRHEERSHVKRVYNHKNRWLE